jgi:hypothetical protein
MTRILISAIITIFTVSCGTNNDTPEPPTNAKVDYFVEYEIDGKREKYIIDTGHLNSFPNLSVANRFGITYLKTYDATNFAGTGGADYPVMPFGKSVYTQTTYPNFLMSLVLRNFSAIKSGDVLVIDSCSLYQPFGNAVGLTYLPIAPPFNDSIAIFYDLGINPKFTSKDIIPLQVSINENAAIKGKNGRIKIISKTFHIVTTHPNLPSSSFYIINGEITGDFMKYKIVKRSGNNIYATKVNLGYKTGKVTFQLPIYSN